MIYRSVLALLFASVLLLSGCAVGQQTVPKEKSGQETNMDGAAFDRSDEEITYRIFKRTPDMVFSLERKKVGNKVKQLPTIHHKYARPPAVFSTGGLFCA